MDSKHNFIEEEYKKIFLNRGRNIGGFDKENARYFGKDISNNVFVNKQNLDRKASICSKNNKKNINITSQTCNQVRI